MSVFKNCEAGHDLTRPDSYIQASNGYRVCRACHLERNPGKRGRFRFDKLGKG